MLSENGRLRRLFYPPINVPDAELSCAEDEEGENRFFPDPAEVLACLTRETVTLIEEGENAETVIYYALEAAYQYGRTAADEAPKENG
ncbi:MAG: hypothetical protein ACOX8W_03615 [bacterium]|jgi:hypothetical protein